MGISNTRQKSVIKSIQRGVVEFYGQPSNVTITISPVDMSKSFVVVSGTGRLERTTASAFPIGMTSRSFTGRLINATQITVSSLNFGISDTNGFADGTAHWQVIEYR